MPGTNAFASTLLITALCLMVRATLEYCGIRQFNTFSCQYSKFVEHPGANLDLQFSNDVHMSAILPLAEAALSLCASHGTFLTLSSQGDAVRYFNSG
jgi:hypothetical protein